MGPPVQKIGIRHLGLHAYHASRFQPGFQLANAGMHTAGFQPGLLSQTYIRNKATYQRIYVNPPKSNPKSMPISLTPAFWNILSSKNQDISAPIEIDSHSAIMKSWLERNTSLQKRSSMDLSFGLTSTPELPQMQVPSGSRTQRSVRE